MKKSLVSSKEQNFFNRIKSTYLSETTVGTYVWGSDIASPLAKISTKQIARFLKRGYLYPLDVDDTVRIYPNLDLLVSLQIIEK